MFNYDGGDTRPLEDFEGEHAELKQQVYNRTLGNHLDWSDADKLRMLGLTFFEGQRAFLNDILRIADKLEALENA